MAHAARQLQFGELLLEVRAHRFDRLLTTMTTITTITTLTDFYFYARHLHFGELWLETRPHRLHHPLSRAEAGEGAAGALVGGGNL